MKGKKVYICSPLTAPTRELIERNMKNVRQYMKQISEKYSCNAVAPHAYLPYILDDTIPRERALALSFGLSLLELCDCLIVCGETISSGMKGEIAKAKELGIDIFHYESEILTPLGIDAVNRMI